MAITRKSGIAHYQLVTNTLFKLQNYSLIDNLIVSPIAGKSHILDNQIVKHMKQRGCIYIRQIHSAIKDFPDINMRIFRYYI